MPKRRIFIFHTPKYVGQEIRVYGWVHSIRSHGKVIFLDIRDRTGILQAIVTSDNEKAYNIAKDTKCEYVVSVEGIVQKRPKGMENPKIITGSIELNLKNIEILSKSKPLPFPIDTPGYEIKEEKRLKFRYLDLRRPRLLRNLEIRQKVIHFVREFLIKRGFLEIETPILTKSTPEGARDFVVPSRLYPGKFYALPQSPQQYKQLLMVAGIERYFQIARCFRDEDPRADRQPEFTQIDIEMSFVSQEEILNLVEKLLISLVTKIFPKKKISQIPFPRIPYREAINNFQTEKPDLRKDKQDPEELAFCFITDFPMFEWKESEKRWDTMHHPFTLPKVKDLKEIKTSPEKILAWQYDVVLNGVEVGGGSLRVFTPELLEAIFEFLGHSKEEIKEKFGHLIEAFQYGVPPHGGIAIGLDRLLSILLSEPSIREVIAFPKTGDSRDLMMETPSEITKEQLKELCLKILKPKK
jgi:aspartyl-tRNA synthetase